MIGGGGMPSAIVEDYQNCTTSTSPAYQLSSDSYAVKRMGIAHALFEQLKLLKLLVVAHHEIIS